MIDIYIRTRGRALSSDYRWISHSGSLRAEPPILREHLGLSRAFGAEHPFRAVGLDNRSAWWLLHGLRSSTRQDSIGRAIVDSAIFQSPARSLAWLLDAEESVASDPSRLSALDARIRFDEFGEPNIEGSWDEALESLVADLKTSAGRVSRRDSGVLIIRHGANPAERFSPARPWDAVFPSGKRT